jgi:hypothetical protein
MRALFNEADAGPIADVEVGMQVVDTTGARLGVVADLSMSDRSALTTQGNEFHPIGGQLRELLGVFSRDIVMEPRVREPVRTRLMRVGYLKIVAPGRSHRARYVRADRIAGVRGNCVELSVCDNEIDTEA